MRSRDKKYMNQIHNDVAINLNVLSALIEVQVVRTKMTAWLS